MEYWKKFYKTKSLTKSASPFATFVVNFNLQGKTAIDLGCGNGRDTYLLSTTYNTTGIDPNFCYSGLKDKEVTTYLKKGWDDVDLGKFDIVYSRFFIHAIPESDVYEIMKRTKGYFVAEARAVGDIPTLYPDHKRYFIDGEKLLTRAIAMGFEIIHYEKGYGMAKYRGEDPLVIRLIAKKV